MFRGRPARARQHAHTHTHTMTSTTRSIDVRCPLYMVNTLATQAHVHARDVERIGSHGSPREATRPGTVATVVVGLYDWENGTRLAIVDRANQPLGEEWTVGTFLVVPAPLPDQACAMIEASCAAQQ